MRERDFHAEKELAKAITRAISKASIELFGMESRTELVKFLRGTPYGFSNIPEDVLALALSKERSDWHPFPFQSTGKMIIKLMQMFGIVSATVDSKEVAQEVFLSDFNRECLKDIGIRPPSFNNRSEFLMGERIV